jgi:hypothetical protein
MRRKNSLQLDIFFLGVRAIAQPLCCYFSLFVAISLILSFELIRQESDGC